jgi:hypothetical protein
MGPEALWFPFARDEGESRFEGGCNRVNSRTIPVNQNGTPLTGKMQVVQNHEWSRDVQGQSQG